MFKNAKEVILIIGGTVDHSTFEQQVEAARRRLEALQQQAGESSEQSALASQALEELSDTLEKLHIARQELCQQNDALIASRWALEAERQRYVDLFEFAPDGYLVTDSEGIIQEANHAAAALLGMSQDVLPCNPLKAFVANDITGQAAFCTRLAQLQKAQTDKLKDWQLWLQPCNDRPFPAEVTVGRVCDAEGRLVSLRWSLRDVTRRIQAEEALQLSEAHYRAIVEDQTEFILRFLPDGSLTFVNGAYCRYLGKTHEQVLEYNWMLLLPVADRPEIEMQLASLTPENPTMTYVFRVARMGWQEWTTRALYDDENNLVEYQSVGCDVTERKQIEDVQWFLLQCGYSGEDFFQLLTRYLADSLDMAYVCIDRLWGDALTAQTVAIYFDGKFEDNITYALKDTPCGNLVGQTICCFPREVRHLFPRDVVLQEMVAESYIGTTLWDSQGHPIGLIAVIGRQPLANTRLAESILKLVAVRAAGELERRQVEEALRDSERKLRTLFDLLPVGVSVLDVQDKTTYVNPALEKILNITYAGLQRGDYRKRTYLRRDGTLMPPDEFASSLAIQERQVVHDVETGIVKEDGQIIWVSVSAMPTDFSDWRAIIVTDDITARKRAEAAIKHLASFPRLNPNPVLEVDASGMIQFCNPAATKILSASGQGGDLRIFLPPDLADILRGRANVQENPVYREVTVHNRIFGEYLHWVSETNTIRIYAHDLTARKQAEDQVRQARDELESRVQQRTQELAQANEKLQLASDYNRSLIEAGLDPFMVINPDGKISDANRATELITGYPCEELVGTDFTRYFSEPDQARAGFEEAFRTGSARDYELELLHRDGSQIAVLYNASVYRDQTGNAMGVFAAARDITAHKQAEKKLYLQGAALDAAANAIIIADRRGDIQWCNPAFLQMTGYPPEQILDHNPQFLWSGYHSLEFYQRIRATIQAGQVWRGEMVLKHMDGHLYTIDQTISPVRNERGELDYFVIIQQDITERKRIEDSERRARQIADTLSAATPALTRTLDLDTVVNTLLDYVGQLVPYDSASVLLLTGEENLVIRATRGYERWPAPDWAHAAIFDPGNDSHIRTLFATRTSVLIADTRQHPGWECVAGIEHVRNWLGVPLVVSNQVIGICALDKAEPGFFTPEHIRLAEMLAAQATIAIQNAFLYDQVNTGRERLQSLSRRLVEVQEAERSYVARELHDETGQALTSLIFGLGQLEKSTELADQFSRIAELKQMTHAISESVHQLAMNLRPVSLDHLGLIPALRQYVTLIGDRYGLIAQFKALGFEGERPLPVVETALYRIVQEALTNVVRHARATRVDVLLERRGDKVIVVVEDDGAGFDADEARFAQSGRLGLLGMQERTEMLGGAMIIESSIGAGTTIVVEVPYGNSHSHR
jgi:PAS domain S-box-containing protein